MEEALAITEALQPLAQQIQASRIAADTIHDEAAVEAAAQRTAVLLTLLRGCNRQAHLEARAVKVQASQQKARIDRLQLDLQGLQYKARHLQQAITRCRDAPHQYTEIGLQPDEVLIAAQPALKETLTDERSLMEARLRFELQTRQTLDRRRKQLTVEKQQLIAENKRRRQELEAIERQLDAFVASAEALSATLSKD